ncbi:polysaccharide pyruvyl transferase family protein [Rahnella sp. RcJ3]|jgi:Polysaccharide pyruvyl transferase.|uniref:polysaccharide pyruvyl transferase family protein n=1 Tax=Rahnella sp. RcJ3 TaxID=2292446 RepID=UPI000E647E4E|nr:polysaccharide pyruvyl transferase family protein [Rahnella sp. RcJ3]AYA08498.1 polysaccharide pyruvyl transferase family protein [Rahnella aquatilis]MQB53301.1 polysaccharide pyruvyl transferase family protein [Rahnella sp. RcJ3]
MNNKFGVMTYESDIYIKRNWINLGDYVQSTAAKQFLNSVDSFIPRDHMNTYSGDAVKMIMNAWYMDIPENFPPARNIEPLYVSIHINSTIVDAIFSKETIQHFKQHEPIGCRDFYTRDLLNSKGIEAYYSGCMTLTLGETYKRDNVTDDVYFIDVMYDSMTIPELLRKPLRLGKRILNGRAFEFNHRNRVLNKYFEPDLIKNAKFETQIIPYVTAKEGFKLADDFLRRLANAKLVVTSRIHTALPCLAMGTPVIFVNGGFKNKVDNCRFDGLFDFFKRIDVDAKGESVANFNFAGDKIGLNTKIKNLDTHLEYSRQLIDKCNSFAR